MFGYAMVMLARNREMSGEQRLPALQLMRMLAPCLPLSVLPPAVQRVLSTVRRVIPQQCSTAVAVHDRSMCAFVGSPLVRRYQCRLGIDVIFYISQFVPVDDATLHVKQAELDEVEREIRRVQQNIETKLRQSDRWTVQRRGLARDREELQQHSVDGETNLALQVRVATIKGVETAMAYVRLVQLPQFMCELDALRTRRARLLSWLRMHRR